MINASTLLRLHVCLFSAAAYLFATGVSHAQLFWKLDNTAGTWTSSNWGTAAAGPFATGWTAGSNAVFNADSTITYVTNTNVGNITVADGVAVNVTTDGTFNTGGNIRTIDVGVGSQFNMAGQNISTAAGTGFIKTGAGTWNMGANGNLYPGGFTLNAGTVIVSGNNSFGGGDLTLNGGTIQSSGGRTFAPSSIVVGGNFEITGTGGWTMNMPVDLGAATRTITNNATGTKTWNGVVSGGSGAGLSLGGTGTNVFTNTANTFDGLLIIAGGEQEFTTVGSLGTGTSIEVDGGRLALRGTFEVPSSKALTIGSNAELSTPGGSTVITYNGSIADKTLATGSWAKQGGGVLELGGVSTYTGDVSINNGTIRLINGDNRLPTGTVVALGQAASTNLGTLDLNGRNQQIAGLNSTTGTNASASKNTVTTASPATLTIGGAGVYHYGLGTAANSGTVTGALALVKTGAGTQVLGESNTHSGGTTINQGSLVATNTAGSATGTGDVTVGSNGTLAGVGRIAPSDDNFIFINGTVQVGDPTLGSPVASSLTLATGGTGSTITGAGSFFMFDLFSGAGAGNNTANPNAADFVRLFGLLNSSLGGTLVLGNPNILNSFAIGDAWTLFDLTSGVITDDFDIDDTALGLDAYLTSSFDRHTGVLSITAIPEPSRLLLIVIGSLGLILRRRRGQ